MNTPGFINEIAKGDPILADYLNGLARAANLNFDATEGYADPDTRLIVSQRVDTILHAWTTAEIPPYSVFGLVAKDSDGSTPRMNAIKFGGDIGPFGIFTNGPITIPADKAGVVWSVPHNMPTRIACDATNKPAQGDPCGPRWGSWIVEKQRGYELLCVDGEDAEIANTIVCIRSVEPVAMLMTVATDISAMASATLGSGTAMFKIRGTSDAIASSGFTTALPVYNFKGVTFPAGSHVLASPVPGVGLVVSEGCYEHITKLQIGASLEIQYKKIQDDCTESDWLDLTEATVCPPSA